MGRSFFHPVLFPIFALEAELLGTAPAASLLVHVQLLSPLVTNCIAVPGADYAVDMSNPKDALLFPLTSSRNSQTILSDVCVA